MAGLAFLRRFSDDKRGTTALIFALTALPVIGVLGAAIDYARAISVASRMQYALDAAVLAAADADASEEGGIALRYFNANFEHGGTFSANTVTTQFGRDSSGNMTGTATSSVTTTVMQILQFDTIPLVVTASAKPLETRSTSEEVTKTTTTTIKGGIPCIHVLDQNAEYSLKLISNSSLDARYCEIHVRTNDKLAIYTDSESNVKWKKIWVKGAGGTMLSGLDTIMDAPNRIEFNQQVVGDPYLQAVSDVVKQMSVGACNNSNTDKSYTGGTVNPGTYCGSTTFNGVKFNPGVYMIASANGNKNGVLNLKGKLDGSAGVSFFLADNKATIGTYTPAEGTALTAPATGTTRGLLFFEASNRGQNWTFTANSMSKVKWNGVIYLPSANVSIKSWSMDEGQTMRFGMVVNRLYADSWSGVTNTYAWTPFNASAPITLPDTITTKTTTETVTTTTTRDGWLIR